MTERGVKVVQGARDLGSREDILDRWVREVAVGNSSILSSRGMTKPEAAKVARLRIELARTTAERKIINKSDHLLCESVTSSAC